MILANTDSYVPEFLVAGIGILVRVYILDITLLVINILLRQLKKEKSK